MDFINYKKDFSFRLDSTIIVNTIWNEFKTLHGHKHLKLFSSVVDRNIYENFLLTNGLEILKNSHILIEDVKLVEFKVKQLLNVTTLQAVYRVQYSDGVIDPFLLNINFFQKYIGN